jgi:small subunit ribosomal protein S13
MFIYKQYNLDLNKEIRASLQFIYGIGWYKAIIISSKLGLSYPFLFKHLNIYNKKLLSFILDFYTWLEIRIKRLIYKNIKHHYDINSYIGLRHKDSLPVRGQRTRTNARTKKKI